MKFLKELKVVLIISLITGILMLVKLSGNSKYSGNVKKAAEISASHSNFLTWNELITSKEKINLIRVDNQDSDSTHFPFTFVDVSAEDIVKREFLKKISQPGTRYVVTSGNLSMAVKTWVILNQLGVENLYILDTADINNELFKFRFQPEPTIRLEPDAIIE